VKTIDLSEIVPTLMEILSQADEDTIIIRTPEGREFVLAAVDNFAQEVALVGKNEELMDFLAQRSKETKRYTLSQVREQLNAE
jgi:hypothetical protein